MILLYAVVAILIFPPKAHAYIDPGTGSYIFQTILAVFLGLSLSFKFILKFAKGLLNRLVSSVSHRKK